MFGRKAKIYIMIIIVIIVMIIIIMVYFSTMIAALVLFPILLLQCLDYMSELIKLGSLARNLFDSL